MGASTSSQPPAHEEDLSSIPPLPAPLLEQFAPTETRAALARLPPSDGELPTTLGAALVGAEAMADALSVGAFRCHYEGETLWERWICGLAAACKQPLADRTAVLVHAALVATEQRQRQRADGPTAPATTVDRTEDRADRPEAGVQEHSSSSVEAEPNPSSNPSSPSATGGHTLSAREGEGGGSSGEVCGTSARDAERWASALLHVHLVSVALEPALPAPTPNDPMLRSLAAALALSPHCEVRR